MLVNEYPIKIQIWREEIFDELRQFLLFEVIPQIRENFLLLLLILLLPLI